MAVGEDIVEVQTYTANVHVPKSGEPVDADTLKVPLQALANRTNKLHNSVDVYRGAGGSATFQFVAADYSLSAQWKFDRHWTQALVAGGNRPVIAPIYLPTGTEITRVRVNIQGVGHSATPTGMPFFELTWAQAGSSGAVVSAGDALVTYPTYDTSHAMDTGTISHTTIGQRVYCVQVYGESGANAQPNGLLVYDVLINFNPIP